MKTYFPILIITFILLLLYDLLFCCGNPFLELSGGCVLPSRGALNGISGVQVLRGWFWCEILSLAGDILYSLFGSYGKRGNSPKGLFLVLQNK